jgi:fatty-acyl-CoA synthase
MDELADITQARYDRNFRDRHLLHGVVEYWAARKPDADAICNATRGTRLTWGELDRVSRLLAGHLHRAGFRQGDFFATSLPLLNEHILLEYACFRAGVIHVPLDLRLAPAEVLRCLGLVRPKGFACLGKTPAADFGALARAVREHCPSVEQLWVFCTPEEAPGGAASFFQVMAAALADPAECHVQIEPGDGAQVIFTTGSTGSPKPALLTHRGITSQNLCLGTAFRFGEDQRVLVNLPPSHVGCQSELMMTTLFTGGMVVTLEVFDAATSLEAIGNHRVTLLGQIPAMFQLAWRHADYGRRDLSSLQTVAYGGQAVSRAFLEKLLTMAPRAATGLGLTEASGFCTYTPLTRDLDVLGASLGYAAPLYPLSIREPMGGDGAAGAALPDGTIGHVCFKGPQTFAGYLNDPEATSRVLSSDGYLYTGDLGWRDAAGLHFSGRAKWVIKPGGNLVFPGDVEEHFCRLTEKVASCGVVGVEHALWSEGIVAFVEKRPGIELTEPELRRHARALTSYMRPLHYVIVGPGGLPLNRVAKIDTLRLKTLAEEEVRQLRQRGRWDRGPVEEP